MHSTQDTIVRLWTAARAMFARLRAALGEAAAIAARDLLTAPERRRIRAWLRPLEAMVRKTVLVEAIALARSPEKRRAAPSSKPAAAARPPAMTIIALPPPVRILAPVPNGSPRARKPAMRLWPRKNASAGPRVRDVGPPVLARDVWRGADRLALARRLAQARARRRLEPERLARRIEALARVLEKPLAAVRRLARKLRALPRLALRLACKPSPRSKLYNDVEILLANIRAHADARAFADTS